MNIYVNCNACKDGNGTKESPFRFINDAAQVAAAGDEVLVAPGVYREYVDPKNAGTEDARIIYKSEVPLGAVITGAEEVRNWNHLDGNVWVCRIDNGVFGGYNPYTTLVKGDWYFGPFVRHTGAVYLNDRQLYEVQSLEECRETSVYKGYKRDKIEMRGDRAEMSDFPLYLNTVAGGLDRRDQTIGGFSFVVKIYAVPVVEIIG